ncbi:MAG TPA: hypothetical protein ENN43_02785 [bacterium]|nr:hypothetical protein [bacterium]
MRVIIDGDSFPAKKEAIEAAAAGKAGVIVVTSMAHAPSEKYAGAELVLVENENQAADIRIMNLAQKGDIVLTNDTGLSLVAVSKGAVVIDAYGRTRNGRELETRMEIVHIEKKALRQKKGKRKIRGLSAYTALDASRLKDAVLNALKNGGKGGAD